MVRAGPEFCFLFSEWLDFRVHLRAAKVTDSHILHGRNWTFAVRPKNKNHFHDDAKMRDQSNAVC